MYIVDVKEKTSKKLPATTFGEIGVKERTDIQEWIAKNPDILEYTSDLLIIQKEFDGFSDTDRRLDLLALDADGNIVVIEIKRDDTGKDVVWQAINYASFCSTLKKEDIIKIYAKYLQKNGISGDAEQRLNEFFDSDDKDYPTEEQKIILVARDFRKEVLSAAQWLNGKGIDITCIKLVPHVYNGELLLDIDRILPQDEMKDYALKLAQKTTESKQQAQRKMRAEQRNVEFWRFFFERFNSTGTVFENVSAWMNKKDPWIGAASGIGRGMAFNFVISDARCRVELYIDRFDKEQNKAVFDTLYKKKVEVEKSVAPYRVEWARLNERRASRIFIEKRFQMDEKEVWPDAAMFLIDAMAKLSASLGAFKGWFDN